MDLELSDEQVALADAVADVLAGEWPPPALRRSVETGAGADELWSRMVELDWPALTVPEDCGGIGYGTVEAAIVLERCGAAAAGTPLFPTMALYTPLVRALGSAEQRARLLGEVAAGTSGTAALEGLIFSHDPGTLVVPAVVMPVTSGWRVSGTMRAVPEIDRVRRLLVPGAGPHVPLSVFVIDTADPGVRIQPGNTLDGSRSVGTVTVDVAVRGDARLDLHGEQGGAALLAAVDEAVTLLAAELVGTCRTVLTTVLDHARSREQFGVKIGSFQALKHRLADTYIDVEAAAASVRFASAALAESDPRAAVAASSAKALASDAAVRVGREAIQILAGIGFTWEHDAHLYVRRALSGAGLLGTAEWHRQRVAGLIGLAPTPVATMERP